MCNVHFPGEKKPISIRILWAKEFISPPHLSPSCPNISSNVFKSSVLSISVWNLQDMRIQASLSSGCSCLDQPDQLRCLHSVPQDTSLCSCISSHLIKHHQTPQTFGAWPRNAPGPFWKAKSTLSSNRRKFCSLCGEGQARALALKGLEVIKCFLMECRRLSKLVQRKCFSSQSILNSLPMVFPLALKHSSEIALPCRNSCPREHLHATSWIYYLLISTINTY